MRYYPQSKIDELISRGSVKREPDSDGNEHLILTINLPEPGGAIVKEEVRSLESATISDWIADPNNPYLRGKFGLVTLQSLIGSECTVQICKPKS